MYRRLRDFLDDFREESALTERLLSGLTVRALAARAGPKARTAGALAWHLPQSLRSIAAHLDLPVDAPGKAEPVPRDPTSLVDAYRRAAASLLAGLEAAAPADAWLEGTVPIYSLEWTRGRILRVLLAHEIHHRGQLTMLLRLAGLPLPAIYGPSADDPGHAG